MAETNLAGILSALAHGASVNYVNEEEESRTPILQALKMVRVCVMWHDCRLGPVVETT